MLLNITIFFQIQVHTQQNPANIMQERKQFHSKDSKGAYFGTQLRHKTKKQLNNEWAWLNRMGDYFRQHRSTWHHLLPTVFSPRCLVLITCMSLLGNLIFDVLLCFWLVNNLNLWPRGAHIKGMLVVFGVFFSWRKHVVFPFNLHSTFG